MADIVVSAPADSGIGAVAGLKVRLMAALDEAGPSGSVRLEIDKVERADSSFAQLVMAFKAEARARSIRAVVAGGEGSLSATLACDRLYETVPGGGKP